MTKIIAFGYKKGTGKDTIGNFLLTNLRCEHPNIIVKHISFAAKLKDICYQLYGWAGLQSGIYYETHRDIKEVILPKIGKSPRDLWIEVGNKLREVYPTTWIDFALQNVKANIVIITDCGFINEAEYLKKLGAILVKINRDGLVQGTDGREVELDNWNDWDFIIDNNGTLQDLNDWAISLAKYLIENLE